MKNNPVQVLLENQNIRTFSYTGRDSEGLSSKCLGAYCTLGGLLRAVSFASITFEGADLNSFITDVASAKTTSGRLFYWPSVRYSESIQVVLESNALNT